MNLTNYDLTPHGFCLNWDPTLLFLTIISNFTIFVAYMWIPAQLMWLAMRRANSQWSVSQYKTVRIIFSLFILCCGIHHLWQIAILFFPYYHVMVAIDIITAIVSISCASILQLNVRHHPKNNVHEGEALRVSFHS